MRYDTISGTIIVYGRFVFYGEIVSLNDIHRSEPRRDRTPVQVWYEALLLYGVLFLPGLFAGAPDRLSFDDPTYHLQLLSVALPQILLTVYLMAAGSREGLERFGVPRFRPTALKDALTAFLGAMALVFTIMFLLSLIPEAGRRVLGGGVSWRLTETAMIPAVAASGLLTGYREELYFRAYLLTIAEEAGVPPMAAVPAASLLFAIGHLYQGLAGLLVTFVLGVYFALVFRRTRNLHAVAIAHGLYNTAVLTLTLIAPAA